MQAFFSLTYSVCCVIFISQEKNDMSTTYERIKNAMLAVQRYPWEQGVCAQALYEAGETETFIAMAHDAVLRQTPDGRLASAGYDGAAVTDPAANGEPVWRAYWLTSDDFYKKAAHSMLDYLMERAPRTESGLICHNTVSFDKGFSPMQIWADSCYMLPPFLAVMGEAEEAERQIRGYTDCLRDPETGLLFHIYDCGTEKFVRRRLWATGNGWALLGFARMGLVEEGTALLNAMLKYRCESGMFHDILDDTSTFEDATSAMMVAAFIYRGTAENWLDKSLVDIADFIFEKVQARVDKFGIIRGVCGSPHFNSPGTSAEAQAVYIMMVTQRERHNYCEIR
jgi:rhamnogalacturonyl hydrolase YesR